MKIKVCGLREPQNITEIAALDVDYLGFIFHAASPRFAGQPKLATWLQESGDLLAGKERFGVFVNAEIDYVLNTVHDYQLDWVQLHGDESAGYCQELKLLWSVNTLRKARICKAFRITENFDFSTTNAYVGSCPLFVFDTGGQQDHGGTGMKWDWSKLAEYAGPVPFLLSGGIGAGDAGAVRSVEHPQLAGVDVNSRFESAPGIKALDLLKSFVSALKS